MMKSAYSEDVRGRWPIDNPASPVLTKKHETDKPAWQKMVCKNGRCATARSSFAATSKRRRPKSSAHGRHFHYGGNLSHSR